MQQRAESSTGLRSGGFFGRNDLQPAAEAICPDVRAAVDWLTRRFGHGRMTGSGSAVFAGVSDSVGMGDRTLATSPEGDWLDQLPEGWVGRMCRSLDSHPLVDWAD